MKIPLSWLKECVPLHLSPSEIGDRLTMLGLEVESMEAIDVTFKKVVAAEVLETSKHPNADSLQLAKVSDGKAVYDLVCAAPNCRPGLRTALAVEGASLLDPSGKEFIIKKAKIRGVESSGMLCSAKELKLSDESDGIMELPEDIPLGTDLATHFGEVILDIGLTPNLNYCASVMGVARELSASISHKFSPPKPHVDEDRSIQAEKLVKLSIEDDKRCPRYMCRVIEDVKIGPSPAWMQKRLAQCGLRSINNVVDVTNYVLLEMGHPLHAFDLDTLSGHEVVVRSARENEKLLTLDGKERGLESTDLVIADREKPIALAGVMGGAATEVTNSTTRVLLESAYFNPSAIRKSSKWHGLQTDASKRFERGADPNGLKVALERATQLIVQVAGGKVAQGIVEKSFMQFPEKKIACRVKRVHQVLGIHLSLSEIEDVFHRLDFQYAWDGQEAIIVSVPTYRVDITSEIDLVEEVARIYGYDNINTQSQISATISSMPHMPIFLFERLVRARLVAEGLQEFLTCDLIGPSQAALLENTTMGADSLIKILNPTSIEQSILRPSLLPGLLQVVKYNFDHQNMTLSGFEIGSIHTKKDEQFVESAAAGIIMTGNNGPDYWGTKPDEVNFYDLKGAIENVFREIGLESFGFNPSELSLLHTGRQASIIVDGQVIGFMGEIHPALLRKIDLPQRVYYAEFNLSSLLGAKKRVQKMHPLPIYPGSERDWTITLREDAPIADVLNVLRSISSRLLDQVTLLDLYRSDRLGKERKNATFHFVYRDLAKTVSQEEVDREHGQVTQEALQKLGKNAI